MKWTLTLIAAAAAFCIAGCSAELLRAHTEDTFRTSKLATTLTSTTTTTTTTIIVNGRALQADEDYQDGDYYYYDGEYDPWENGTPVYYEFEGDGWYEGEITGFDSEAEAYQITWSDGDVENYDDFNVVDQMVYDYANMVRDHDDGNCEEDAWPDETDIYVFEDGRGWWGKITQCQDGVYTATWENGDVGYYDEGVDFDKMVTDAQKLSNNQDASDNFDSDTAVHDFTTQTYNEGTVVYKEFDDGWYQGQIMSFQNGMYSVQWSDGELDDYAEGDEMDQMVADAVNVLDKEDGAGLPTSTTSAAPPGNDNDNDKKKKNGGGGGVVFVIILLVTSVGCVVVLKVVRRNRNKYAAKKQQQQQDTITRDHPEFQDEVPHVDGEIS